MKYNQYIISRSYWFLSIRKYSIFKIKKTKKYFYTYLKWMCQFAGVLRIEKVCQKEHTLYQLLE